MLRCCGVLAAILLAAGGVYPQSKPEPLKFDVASVIAVDPNAPGIHMMGVQVFPGGRIQIARFSLKALIATAFALSYWQLSGGEAWMEKDLYDVEAKPSPDIQPSIKNLRFTNFTIEDARLREMLQTLVIDRFQLRFRHDTKTGDVFLLQQNGKPLTLKPTKMPNPLDEPGSSTPPPTATTAFGSIGFAGGKWVIFATSMPQLAKFASGMIFHAPVLDKTELSGVFDHRQIHPDLDPTYAGDQSASFRSFLSELGLKVESAKGPVELFVIEHAARPSAN